jgi:hypothetical protein
MAAEGGTRWRRRRVVRNATEAHAPPLYVEVAQERYAKLQLKTDDTVFPKRVRVFVHDYQI